MTEAAVQTRATVKRQRYKHLPVSYLPRSGLGIHSRCVTMSTLGDFARAAGRGKGMNRLMGDMLLGQVTEKHPAK